MPIRTILLSLLLLPCTTAFSQNTATTGFVSNFDTVLAERFVGGEDGFLRHFYEKIRYPSEARKNCRLGQLLAKVTVSPEGEIQAIQFLNKLGNGIEQSVETVLQATAGKWNTSNESTDIFFSIAFMLDNVAEIAGDMKVVAYGGSPNGGDCEGTEQIEAQLSKALKKGKQAKAIECYEELLRRYPLSEEYLKAYNDLMGSK